MYKCKLTNIYNSNSSLKNSDCVLIPKNMSDNILSKDSEMYCFKITHKGKLVYCRFFDISPDEYVHVPKWILDDLDYAENNIVNVENVEINEGKLLKIQCSREVSDPTKILEFELRDHKIFYIGKKVIIKMFNDFEIKFRITETDDKKPIRISSEICYDITFDNF